MGLNAIVHQALQPAFEQWNNLSQKNPDLISQNEYKGILDAYHKALENLHQTSPISDPSLESKIAYWRNRLQAIDFVHTHVSYGPRMGHLDILFRYMKASLSAEEFFSDRFSGFSEELHEKREFLKRGSAATIYKRDDFGPNHTPIALKYYHPIKNGEPHHIGTPCWGALSDAYVTSSLQSPHLVSACDFGIFQGGLYLAMEAGTHDLSEEIKTNRQEAQQNYNSLIVAVLEGLAVLHEAGMVHRDVHLENVICYRKKQPTYKLADFGLTTSAQDLIGKPPSIYHCGNIIATPPEVVRLKRSFVEERFQFVEKPQYTYASDLFSAGAVFLGLYLPVSDDPSELIRQRIIFETFSSKPPSLDIPSKLASFLKRLLDLNPENRFANGRMALEEYRKLMERA